MLVSEKPSQKCLTYDPSPRNRIHRRTDRATHRLGVRVKKFSISIEQVENGYVVWDGPHYSGQGFPSKQWVADNIPDLMELVGNLATKCPNPHTGES